MRESNNPKDMTRVLKEFFSSILDEDNEEEYKVECHNFQGKDTHAIILIKRKI